MACNGRRPKVCCYSVALVAGVGEQSTAFISYGGAAAAAPVWGRTAQYSHGWTQWRGLCFAKHAENLERQTIGEALTPGGVRAAATPMPVAARASINGRFAALGPKRRQVMAASSHSAPVPPKPTPDLTPGD